MGTISSSNVSGLLPSCGDFITDVVISSDWSDIVNSAAHVVHADRGFNHGTRRVPQYLVRGPFNQWGFDKGINSVMTKNNKGQWELEIMARWPTFVQLNVFAFNDFYYGDTDGDGILDRLPPNSAAPNFLNMSAPPHPVRVPRFTVLQWLTLLGFIASRLGFARRRRNGPLVPRAARPLLHRCDHVRTTSFDSYHHGHPRCCGLPLVLLRYLPQ